MAKIGLFFGSFNPIHIGHTAIAGYIKEFTDLEQIWFVVSPQNPLKKKDTLLPDRDRLYLVELAVADNDSLKPSDIEFNRPMPSYTIDTMMLLKEKYADYNFALVMGEDNLYTLHKWKNAIELIRQFPLYIYPRPGAVRPKSADLEALLSKARLRRVKAPLMEISGTFIRDGIRRGKNMSYFLNPPVWNYIKEMHYYEK